jgi:hypothetical protein
MEMSSVGFNIWTDHQNVIQINEDKYMSALTRSIRSWKVCPAFLTPNDILVHSQSPKDVMMAILGISFGHREFDSTIS